MAASILSLKPFLFSLPTCCYQSSDVISEVLQYLRRIIIHMIILQDLTCNLGDCFLIFLIQGFLNHDIVDIWAWMSLCCRGLSSAMLDI